MNFLSYVFVFGNVVDFWATIPWYIWWAIGEKLRHLVLIGNLLRTLRVLRLFRARALSSPYILLLFGAVVKIIIFFLIFLGRKHSPKCTWKFEKIRNVFFKVNYIFMVKKKNVFFHYTNEEKKW